MASIAVFHGYILGLAVVSVWAVICFWALALRLLGYEDTPTFWRAVSVAQVLLGVQLLAGVILLGWWLFGNGPAPGARSGGGWFNATFHLLYGIVFPFIVLLVGHDHARKGQRSPHSVFSVVGLVIFGLTARAFTVGAGIGA